MQIYTLPLRQRLLNIPGRTFYGLERSTESRFHSDVTQPLKSKAACALDNCPIFFVIVRSMSLIVHCRKEPGCYKKHSYRVARCTFRVSKYTRNVVVHLV